LFLKPHQLLDVKVRDVSHQAMDEVLKTIGEIYEQEYYISSGG